MDRISIGKDAAIEMAAAQWWKMRTADEVFQFQMTTKELCMPASLFHQAAEKALNRPVSTLELVEIEQLWAEYWGERKPPTVKEIRNQILQMMLDDDSNENGWDMRTPGEKPRMTPEDALAALHAIANAPHDPEAAHGEADGILCAVLAWYGHEDIVTAFDAIHKWYA